MLHQPKVLSDPHNDLENHPMDDLIGVRDVCAQPYAGAT